MSTWDKIVGFLGLIHQHARDSGIEHEAVQSITSFAEKALEELEVSPHKAVAMAAELGLGVVKNFEGSVGVSTKAEG